MSTLVVPDAVPSRAARHGSPVSLSRASGALLLLALVLGNAALSRAVLRVDLTQDRLYTLSDTTRRVVSALTDPCRIRVYWGEKIPTSAAPVRRRLEGLLDEYQAASGGRVEVVWVKMDEKGEREAGEKNVYEGTFQVFSANEVSAVKAYHGLAILYEDRVETVGPLADVSEDQSQYRMASDLEYEITSTIYKVSRTSKAVVAVVSDAPAMNFMNPQGGGDRFSVLTGRVLERVYGNDLRTGVSLDAPVPADVTVLLVLAPREWPEKRVFHLEQFLLRGGKVFLLHDTADLRVAWGGQPQYKSGLEDWLKSIGVEVKRGVVADFDEESQCAALTEAGGRRYPFWPMLRKAQIDQECPATRDVDGVPLYFAQELVADAAKQKEAGRSLTVLATTSPKGWTKESLAGLNSWEMPDEKELSKRTVMLAIEGSFASYWKGKPSPDEPPPAAPAAEAPGPGGAAPASGAAMGEPGMGEPGMGAPSMGEPAMDGAAMETPPAGEPGMDGASMAEPAMDGAAMSEPPAMDDAAMGEPPAMEAGAKGPEGAPGETPPAKDAKPARLDEGRGTLVILGDADLVADDFSGLPRRDVTGGATQVWNKVNGFRLVPSVVDWLTGSEDVIALRARGTRTRKFDEISPSKATEIKVLNYAVAPLLVLCTGLFLYVVRRYRK